LECGSLAAAFLPSTIYAKDQAVSFAEPRPLRGLC